MRKFLLTFITIGAFLTACKKDALPELKTDNDNILKFESLEDFFDSYAEVSSMDHISAEKWANTRGFSSICAQMEQKYFSIDFEAIKTHDELYEIVKTNKPFFELTNTDEGDLIVEPSHICNNLRYFANKDLMFKIDNFVCKLTEHGIIVTEEDNIDFLRSINEQNIGEYANDKKLRVFSTSIGSNENLQKGQICSTNYCENEGFSGRNRVTVALNLDNYHVGDQNIPYHTLVKYSYSVKAHRKTDLGFWYIARRTLSADLKVNIDITTNTGTTRVFHRFQESGDLGYGLTGSQIYYATPKNSGILAPLTSKFGPINAWGDSPDVEHVYINCFN